MNRTRRPLIRTALLLAALLPLANPAASAETITLASTTSVENSGLLAAILPGFTRSSGIEVRVLAQGTGQALATAARGDADLALVHDPEAEAAFMAAGHGTTRREIAWNDFIFVGPKDDPARIAGTKDATAALKSVAAAATPFVSRGDNSGTNALELRLWKAANIAPKGAPWYRDIGGGMGAALNAAAAMGAITITDRGTWISFRNRRDLIELVAGDPALINRYNVIELKPNGQPPSRLAAAKTLADWLCAPEGQSAIAAYILAGERLFNPSAK